MGRADKRTARELQPHQNFDQRDPPLADGERDRWGNRVDRTYGLSFGRNQAGTVYAQGLSQHFYMLLRKTSIIFVALLDELSKKLKEN